MVRNRTQHAGSSRHPCNPMTDCRLHMHMHHLLTKSTPRGNRSSRRHVALQAAVCHSSQTNARRPMPSRYAPLYRLKVRETSHTPSYCRPPRQGRMYFARVLLLTATVRLSLRCHGLPSVVAGRWSLCTACCSPWAIFLEGELWFLVVGRAHTLSERKASRRQIRKAHSN